MKGWIYRIYHKQKDTGENCYPDKCYIGQTNLQGGVKARFKRHIRDCNKQQIGQKQTGKEAKLHSAMLILGTANFDVQVLEKIEKHEKSELSQKLNEREYFWQKKYNSVDSGWNKVYAPQTRAKDKLLGKESIADLAKQHDVAYTSLLHRINNLNETPEQAIAHLKNIKDKPKTVYRYGRQEFKSYRSLSESRFNINSLDHKTIENRARKLIKKGDILCKEEDGKIIIDIVDSVFDAVEDNAYQIPLPDQTIVEGSIREIYDKLKQREEFKAKLPGYQTVISRLNKGKQGKVAWTIEQAFSLDYPPNLSHVKYLIETEGYEFIPEAPNFNNLANCKPIILEATKEVFISQKIFCGTYKIPEDQFSDLKNKGMSVEQILEHLGIKA